MTGRLHFHFLLSWIGEGNGNPLQCSCLEYPRDRGAWWAAIYGVAQSQTWLKWLNSLISMCLGIFLLGFILYGILCASWTWLTIPFFMLGKFSTIISSKIFSYPFFFSSSSGTPIIQMLVCLLLSQRSLRPSSVLFIVFTLFCSSEVISTLLSSSSLICSSASDILLLIPFRVFLISVIVLFVYLFLILLGLC